jgi:NADPH:quinone reductase-like Zn-dependent oxidoreductase
VTTAVHGTDLGLRRGDVRVTTLGRLRVVPGPRPGPAASRPAAVRRGRDSGRLHIPVDRTFPLADIARAHRLAERDVRAKVVVTVAAGHPEVSTHAH